MKKRICVVAVDVATYAIDKLYTYRLPEPICDQVDVGCRVLVPFGPGNKRTEGIILNLQELSARDHLKPVIEILDDYPVLNMKQIKLAIWLRETLYCTFFDCIRVMLPSGLWFRRKEIYTWIGSDDDRIQLNAEGFEKLLSVFTDHSPSRTLEEIKILLGGRNVTKQLDGLCTRGVLTFHSEVKQRTSDMMEKMFQLAISFEDAMNYATRRGRKPVQLEVISLLSDGSAMSRRELSYMSGVSDSILRTMCKNGILETFTEERLRTPDFSNIAPATLTTLTDEQNTAYTGIHRLLNQGKPSAALLHGITGSGKTQVYLHLIADILAQGQSAIVLVPEIGLTPQFIRIFVTYFGSEVAILHSALSSGERYDSWKKIRSGNARVVIGTRSAVFAPVQKLGILIIDEEHDGAYKSEQSPRYHAREVAKFRVKQENALLLLGSATPSVESYWSAKQGKYSLEKLSDRYLGVPLPEVIITDMRGLVRQGNAGMISPTLLKHLKQTLECHEQSILFLNRRGNSRVIGCTMCGWVPECPSCSTTMTYHSANSRVICHYCGASMKISDFCPNCGSNRLFMEQAGTQKIEEELHALLPNARVLRMDADTTSTKNAHQRLLEIFAKGRADILLGTQMVAKGLDFDNVSLVGVVDADQALYTQSFRAHERTFSLITQVIGRAGRRNTVGRAIIQTYSPGHPVILSAARQDYETFYNIEIEHRKALLCPPISQLLLLVANGEHEQYVLSSLLRLKARLMSLMEGQFRDFKFPVLGPAPANIVRIAGRYRYHLTLRCPDNRRRRELISGIFREFIADKRNKGINLYIDINPDSL